MTREEFRELGFGDDLLIPGHGSTKVVGAYFQGSSKDFRINILTLAGFQCILEETEASMIERDK